jgi:pilus assembly protein Flp/PilA
MLGMANKAAHSGGRGVLATGLAKASGKVWKLFNQIRTDEEGAAMAEYVVLLGLIVGALVLVITNFAGVLQHKFTSVCASLGGTC